jgi:hypothetical protein
MAIEELWKQTIPGGAFRSAGRVGRPVREKYASEAPGLVGGPSLAEASRSGEDLTGSMRGPMGGALRAFQAERAATTARGGELGEPTSFAGGAGAPEPIAVMRGTATTFSPGRPEGAQFVLPEVATPVQAQQSWNRAQLQRNLGQVATDVAAGKVTPQGAEGFRTAATDRYGEYVAPGQTLADIKYARPLQKAQAEVVTKQMEQAEKDKLGTDFDKLIKRRFGTPSVGKSGNVDYALPSDEFMLRDLAEAREHAVEQKNVQAGMNYMEWSKRLRQMYPDVYATTMRENPLAWREMVINAGPQLAKRGPVTDPGGMAPIYEMPGP